MCLEPASALGSYCVTTRIVQGGMVRVMKRGLFVLVWCALLVGATGAQNGSPLTAELKAAHEALRADVVQSAERMSAEHFEFQPTPEVRTFGELVGHIATSLYASCAAAGAEGNPHPEVVEQTVSGKTALVEALKAAYDYCEEMLASLNDVNGLEKVREWREGTRLSFLVEAVSHTSLHYGNMVTSMRLKGLVPASTDRRDAAPIAPAAPVKDRQPPGTSPPVMTRLEYRFPTQDNRSLRFVRTYVLQAETPRHVSTPSRDRWVPYSEAEPVILDDAGRFWKSGQFESLWVDVVDRPFENGVVGRVVTFNFVERADIEVPTPAYPTPPPEYQQPPAASERLYPPPEG